MPPLHSARRVAPDPRQYDLFDLGVSASPAVISLAVSQAPPPALTFYLDGDRLLPSSSVARAQANVDAIRLSAEIVAERRPATADEQARLALFTGFGASDLANGAFRRPGEAEFRQGWADVGVALETAVSDAEYEALTRSTQYAHFTPEVIVRAMWRALEGFGFRGGAVLEPGIGSGLFPSLVPAELRPAIRLTGIEADPVTARIVGLLHPNAEIRAEDFAASRLPRRFALAIGNPPFSNRVINSDPAYRGMGLRLHDFFITKAVDHLLPGGLAAFVTSQGTMDKADSSVRARLAASCDLIAAIRLPEGAFRAGAGTDVGVDILFLRKPLAGEARPEPGWIETRSAGIPEFPDLRVNGYFLDNPAMVLGDHAAGSGPYGVTYACRAQPGKEIATSLANAVLHLPRGFAQPVETSGDLASAPAPVAIASNDNLRLREGSYFVSADDVLMQVIDGSAELVAVKSGRGDPGIFPKHAAVIRGLIPIRDAVRAILHAQEHQQPHDAAQAELNVAYDRFAARFGPINETVVSVREATDDAPRSETHRRPNLSPFADDPDCWLVSSIEEYSLETGEASKGLIFFGAVLERRPEPEIRTASDALALCLHETGGVDLAFIAERIGMTEAAVLTELGGTLYRNPASGRFETADAYLSGKVRDKLRLAQAAAGNDPAYRRNIDALEAVQPTDIPPSDITARLGAPWIPVDVIEAFVREVMDVRTQIQHMPNAAAWTVKAWDFRHKVLVNQRWGTPYYTADRTLFDALNARIPAIYDEVRNANGGKSRELNAAKSEAAKEKLAQLKAAFSEWVWKDEARAELLGRFYNDTFNNLVARRYDGAHLRLPGASSAFVFRPHQLNAIWRLICGGSYIAHAVGAGKTAVITAAIMEQRRLGLIGKAILTVPGHCLAQCAREFLAIYPLARILVADEQNFARDKRRRFLARAATGDWDAVIITHSAFKMVPVPKAFEQMMLDDMVEEFESAIELCSDDDRITRKKLEYRKEVFQKKLENLAARHDDFLTMSEIGLDQIYVDEAQEFRKLSFTTNTTSLKGVDSEGSQAAWDLYVKASFVRAHRRHVGADGEHAADRALNLASGTPITNTLGEMFTLMRFMCMDALRERDLHEFDAWASAFGETRTDLELQPSGQYKPVTRFAEFVNVPELIDLFRTFADVVSAEDLRRYVKRPPLQTGKRQLITSPATPAFRAYQKLLGARVKAIEARKGMPKPGDDILLSVITHGRLAAMDLRFVLPDHEDEPESKLWKVARNVFAIHTKHADRVYLQPDGTPYPRPGATQMVFSDLGTPGARAFSAYRDLKAKLIGLGIPADEIAFVQDYKGAQAKNRLFAEMRAGKVRIVLGSTRKMGTGVNAQNRLVALHHIDVPWLPSDIEQREGRIDRQGNQNDEIAIFAYATEGSMDAQMWQANERKARFIAAALRGDRSVRRIEDVGEGAASQFAMAKAIASGDPRLMQMAGLQAEVGRLERLRSSHYDHQHIIRSRIERGEREIRDCLSDNAHLAADIAKRGELDDDVVFRVAGRDFQGRTEAGRALVDAMNNVDFLVAGNTGSRSGITDRVVATVRGFEIVYTSKMHRNDFIRDAGVRLGHATVDLRARSNTAGAIAYDQVCEVLLGLERRVERNLSTIEFHRDQIEASLPARGLPFDMQGELDLKREELDALTADLARTDANPVPASVGAAA